MCLCVLCFSVLVCLGAGLKKYVAYFFGPPVRRQCRKDNIGANTRICETLNRSIDGQ